MLTPLDIESKVFKKSAMGYNSQEVDQFIKQIVNDYEKIYKENIEMKDKLNLLNEGIQYYKSLEESLNNALVLAGKTAEETKMNAYNKADQIEKEAQVKAQAIVHEARNELSYVRKKIDELIQQYNTSKTQIKQFLKTQLEIIEEKQLTDINNTLDKSYKEFMDVRVKEIAENDNLTIEYDKMELAACTTEKNDN